MKPPRISPAAFFVFDNIGVVNPLNFARASAKATAARAGEMLHDVDLRGR
jgi:hypothetical protein